MIFKPSFRLGLILLINIIIAIYLICWLLTHISIERVFNEISQVDILSIIISVALGLVVLIVYGLRLSQILNISLSPSLQIVTLGFGLNSIFPFRTGELVKIYLTKNFFKIDLTKAVYATVIEKIVDLLIIMMLASVFLYRNLYFIFAVIIIFLLYLSIKKYYGFTKFDKIQKLFIPKNLIAIINYSILIWLITWLNFYLFFAMNINSTGYFNYFDGIILLVFTTLSLTIPSLPANIGLFEAGIVYYLTTHFNWLDNKAIAYALIFHLTIILPQLILSFIIVIINLIARSSSRILRGISSA